MGNIIVSPYFPEMYLQQSSKVPSTTSLVLFTMPITAFHTGLLLSIATGQLLLLGAPSHSSIYLDI